MATKFTVLDTQVTTNKIIKTLISKLHTLGKDLTDFSLETVRMFHSDAVSANYRL